MDFPLEIEHSQDVNLSLIPNEAGRTGQWQDLRHMQIQEYIDYHSIP